jgi:thrombospondin 2/3/4/5
MLPALAAIALAAGAVREGPDGDLDGVPDASDNCQSTFNPDQRDDDDDGVGNSCDSTLGIAPDESKVVLYARDQRGRPVTGACFTVKITRPENVDEDESCGDYTEQGSIEIVLRGPEDSSAEIVQIAAPPGCAGGLSRPLAHTFTSGSWRIVDIRYRCGTPALDRDYDGVANDEDNCPNVFNPDQSDHDEDEIGNTCDSSPGTPTNVSTVILYLRDQDGAPLWDACFQVTVTLSAGSYDADRCVDFGDAG